MSAFGPGTVSAQDLPICFPARPCVDYSALAADAINLTSNLTGASQAIAIGCLAVLGVALVLVAFGLTRRSGPGLGIVALSTGLLVLGALIASVVDIRLTAIASIYGPEGPGGPDLFGSWSLVGLAGEAMAAAGSAGLVATATVAVVRLHSIIVPAGRAPAP